MLPKNLPPLTGIRGVAALWVICLHFGPGFGVILPLWKEFDFIWTRGHEGVPLFYLLSGFILSHVYDTRTFKASQYGAFIRHRFFRIYPVHLAMLLILAVMVLASHALHIAITGQYSTGSFIYNLFLIQRFPFIHEEGWNYPAWTVSVEWFAYLVAFPAGCFFARVKSASYVNCTFLLSLCSIGCALVVQRLPFFSTVSSSFEGALIFLGGVFLHQYVRDRPNPSRLSKIGSLMILMTPALLYLTPDTICRPVFVLFCPFILITCLNEKSVFARFCSCRPVLYLGTVSYSLYMTHALTLKLLKILLHEDKFSDSSLFLKLGVFCLYWAAILAATVLSYYMVEKPSRRWFKARYG